jgi:hypothetical protein
VFLDNFDVLMSKKNFEKKNFNIFSSEKHFEKQQLTQYQTGSKLHSSVSYASLNQF